LSSGMFRPPKAQALERNALSGLWFQKSCPQK
jgi:hypothetical protein